MHYKLRKNDHFIFGAAGKPRYKVQLAQTSSSGISFQSQTQDEVNQPIPNCINHTCSVLIACFGLSVHPCLCNAYPMCHRRLRDDWISVQSVKCSVCSQIVVVFGLIMCFLNEYRLVHAFSKPVSIYADQLFDCNYRTSELIRSD